MRCIIKPIDAETPPSRYGSEMFFANVRSPPPLMAVWESWCILTILLSVFFSYVLPIQQKVCDEECQQSKSCDDSPQCQRRYVYHVEDAQSPDKIHSGMKNYCKRIQPESLFILAGVKNKKLMRPYGTRLQISARQKQCSNLQMRIL